MSTAIRSTLQPVPEALPTERMAVSQNTEAAVSGISTAALVITSSSTSQQQAQQPQHVQQESLSSSLQSVKDQDHQHNSTNSNIVSSPLLTAPLAPSTGAGVLMIQTTVPSTTHNTTINSTNVNSVAASNLNEPISNSQHGHQRLIFMSNNVDSDGGQILKKQTHTAATDHHKHHDPSITNVGSGGAKENNNPILTSYSHSCSSGVKTRSTTAKVCLLNKKNIEHSVCKNCNIKFARQ